MSSETSEGTSRTDPALRISSFFKKRKLRTALGIAFTGGLLYFAIDLFSPATVVAVLAKLNVVPALLSLAAYVLITAVRAWRFRLAGADIPAGALFRIASIHAALLRIMPLRSGELAYGFLIRRAASGGMAEGIATIIVLRILDLTIIIPLAVFALVTLAAETPSHWVLVGLSGAFLLSVLMFFSLGFVGKALGGRFSIVEPERHSVRLKGKQRKWQRLAETVLHVAEITSRRKLSLLGVTVVHWAGILFWFYLSLVAVGAIDELGDGIRVGILGVTGSVLPLSLIGSFGPMESGFAIGLRAAGQITAVATANAIVVSGLTFVANWLLALPCLVVEIFSRRV